MPVFICPLCRCELQAQAKTWRCSGGHSFDVAREGYVNLLPVQHKHSLAPGDNTDMVQARRAFLQAGHYAPLRNAITATLAPLQAQALLDIGCGEGYYTSAFRSIVPFVVGLDIAKPAVRLAAKQFQQITWLVGSSASLPLADVSVDVVSSLFSPLPIAEMQRVLKAGAHLLVVTPAADHLLSLRRRLFDEVRPHAPEKFIAAFDAQFELRQRETLRFPLRLAQTDLKQLLSMTPYAWRAKPERRAAAEALADFEDEAAFALLLFRKRSYV